MILLHPTFSRLEIQQKVSLSASRLWWPFHNQVTWELQKIFGLDPWMVSHRFFFAAAAFFWVFSWVFFLLHLPKIPRCWWYHMISDEIDDGSLPLAPVVSGKKIQWNQWWSHQECFLRTCKILTEISEMFPWLVKDDDVKVACTAVRVPTLRAHSESITVETEEGRDDRDSDAEIESMDTYEITILGKWTAGTPKSFQGVLQMNFCLFQFWGNF